MFIFIASHVLCSCIYFLCQPCFILLNLFSLSAMFHSLVVIFFVSHVLFSCSYFLCQPCFILLYLFSLPAMFYSLVFIFFASRVLFTPPCRWLHHRHPCWIDSDRCPWQGPRTTLHPQSDGSVADGVDRTPTIASSVHASNSHESTTALLGVL